MKAKRFLTSGMITAFLLVLITGLAVAQAPDATPLGTGFTYQGQLKSDSTPYTGTCDFQFGLYDAATMGSAVGELTVTNVTVSGGFFTSQLDFGSGKFTGDNRWLEILVRCPAGTGTYTELTPRQPLTAAPYALYASSAGAVPWSGISGIPAGFADGVDNDTTYTAGTGLILAGTSFSVDTTIIQNRVTGTCTTGSAIRQINTNGTVVCESVGNVGWSLTGNSGTIPGTNFIGTSDNQPLEIKVNNQRVFRFEPYTASPNLIGGHSANAIVSGVFGATISGGGASDAPNLVTDQYGTIGGGMGNQAGDNDADPANKIFTTVAGGANNVASGDNATICGGYANTAGGFLSFIGGGNNNQASAEHATISGGSTNSASDIFSFIGGGSGNTASNQYAIVVGGWNNIASSNYATVGGGGSNTGSGSGSTISGGFNNTAYGYASSIGGGYLNTAMGNYSTIPGGFSNSTDGNRSFAAGSYTDAMSEGCFVWGDASTTNYLLCEVNNRWLARASGGVYFYTNSGTTTGSYLAAGGNSWNSLSNRNAKENFTTLDTQQLLVNLAKVPITTWNYKEQDPSIIHVGLMADEFNNLITGLGGEGKDYINSMDAVGVSLAAIQGLYAENLDLKAELADQQSQIDNLETRLMVLESGGSVSAGLSNNAVPWMLLFGLLAFGGIGLLNHRSARGK